MLCFSVCAAVAACSPFRVFLFARPLNTPTQQAGDAKYTSIKKASSKRVRVPAVCVCVTVCCTKCVFYDCVLAVAQAGRATTVLPARRRACCGSSRGGYTNTRTRSSSSGTRTRWRLCVTLLPTDASPNFPPARARLTQFARRSLSLFTFFAGGDPLDRCCRDP